MLLFLNLKVQRINFKMFQFISYKSIVATKLRVRQIKLGSI